MALQAIFDAVAERLGDAISIGGPDQVDHESRPPRITWKPVQERYSKPRRLSGGPGQDGPIHTREWTLRLMFWGESLLATERLVDEFLATLHDLITAHSYSPNEGVWDTGRETVKGALCTLMLTLYVPVLRTVQPTRSITAIKAIYTMAME